MTAEKTVRGRFCFILGIVYKLIYAIIESRMAWLYVFCHAQTGV